MVQLVSHAFVNISYSNIHIVFLLGTITFLNFNSAWVSKGNYTCVGVKHILAWVKERAF